MKSILIKITILLFAFSIKNYGQTNDTNSKKQIENPITMKEFSLLVRVPVSYTQEQAKEVNPKWNALLDKWRAENRYIISFAFPGDSYIVSGSQKTVKKEAVISENLKVVSNLFIRAVSIEEAVELAKSIPILEFDGSVEVREIPPRPVKTENKN